MEAARRARDKGAHRGTRGRIYLNDRLLAKAGMRSGPSLSSSWSLSLSSRAAQLGGRLGQEQARRTLLQLSSGGQKQKQLPLASGNAPKRGPNSDMNLAASQGPKEVKNPPAAKVCRKQQLAELERKRRGPQIRRSYLERAQFKITTIRVYQVGSLLLLSASPRCCLFLLLLLRRLALVAQTASPSWPSNQTADFKQKTGPPHAHSGTRDALAPIGVCNLSSRAPSGRALLRPLIHLATSSSFANGAQWVASGGQWVPVGAYG